MLAGLLPSEQVAPVRSQPAGTVSAHGVGARRQVAEARCAVPSCVARLKLPSCGPVKVNAPSPPTVFFTTVRLPRLMFVKVQVTFSPAPQVDIGRVAAVRAGRTGRVPSPPATFRSGRSAGNRLVERTRCAVHPIVARLKLPNCGLVKAKLPSPPTVFLTIGQLPRLVLAKTQMTFSPGARSMLAGSLPSEQVGSVRSQPARRRSQ